MSWSTAADALPLLVIVCAATVAIFYHKFRDNLPQRIGLSCLAVGAVLKLLADMQAASGHAGLLLVVYGAAFYGSGCMWKLIKKARRGR